MITLASKRFLFIGVLLIFTFLAWFLVQMNPNVGFQRFKKQVARSYQKEVKTLSDTAYHLAIQKPAQLEAERHFYEYHLMHFRPATPAKLNERNKAEWHRLQQHMQDRLLKINQLRSDFSLYNLGGALKATLVRKNLEEQQKWQLLESQLEEAALYYATAKDNLVKPDAQKSALAIEKQLLTLQFLQSELLDSLARSSLREPQRQTLVQYATRAQIAVKDYIAFCRSHLFEYHNESWQMKK